MSKPVSGSSKSGDETTTVETDPFKPMDVSDDSLVSFYGEIRRDLNDDNDTADPGEVVFTNLKAHLKLDEDVGAGGTGLPGEEDNAVAPWLSIQQSIPADATIGLMYIVYHTSEYETLVGGLKAAWFRCHGPSQHRRPNSPTRKIRLTPPFSLRCEPTAELVDRTCGCTKPPASAVNTRVTWNSLTRTVDEDPDDNRDAQNLGFGWLVLLPAAISLAPQQSASKAAR